jgi:hypothetical protein
MSTSRIKLFSTLGPRIDAGRVVDTDTLVEYLSGRTTLHESIIRHVVLELREAIRFYGVEGRGVRIEGLGIFRPTIGADGQISLSYRADRALANDINAHFRGDIINRQNIGKSTDDLKALWNEMYPDNPAD